MDSIIHLKDVRKSFNATAALKGISLDIPKGRVVGLVGPNGSGKTTLIKAILGLLNVEGDISVLGMHPVKDHSRLMEDTGVIFESPVLPKWMTVSQLLNFYKNIVQGFDRQKCERFLADKTSLSLSTRISHLSKGMEMQLNIALLMARKTRLTILDEPTLGLDPLFRRNLYNILLEEYFDADKTFLISSHQIEEIEPLVTDVIFLKEGKVLLTSTKEELSKSFITLTCPADQKERYSAMHPLYQFQSFGKLKCVFQAPFKADMAFSSEASPSTLSDIFFALMDKKP